MMRDSVLIVDDVEMNRDILSMMLQDDYKLLVAEDGIEALDMLEKHSEEIAAVLLDLLMPRLDGFGVLKKMKELGYLNKMPVLIISGETSPEIHLQCLNQGATDFITKPFDVALVKIRVQNNIELYQYKNNLEARVEKQMKKIMDQNEQFKQLSVSVIDLLGNVVEFRDEDSGDHIFRVRKYCNILARTMRDMYPEYAITDRQIELITIVSVIHDTGKVAIPNEILCKPGKLTKEEFEEMKKHTVIGYDMINKFNGVWSDELKKIALEVTRWHHEKWDGRGYPDGLVGDEIPMSSQIVSVADVYDALIHKRVYKDAYPKEAAFNMILNGECGQFNPKLMECFKRARFEMEAVQSEAL